MVGSGEFGIRIGEDPIHVHDRHATHPEGGLSCPP